MRNILNKEEEMEKFKKIVEIFDTKIIKSFGSINKIVNRIAKGSAMVPDFIRTYKLSSEKVHEENKIELGQCLEDYYSEI